MKDNVCARELLARHSSLLSDLMALTTQGQSPLRCCQDNRKVNNGEEDVAIIKEPTPQPGHAMKPRETPCEGNSEPNRRALASAKSSLTS
jgi:hypothetical protein